eukprot:TRINITY_DN156_c1_g1_i2.p1 TRINITY_DN156_c1_g1~~TRINITY_DN156_c1_g1_i2.p1  ORF type:complete len:743 (-),score=184.89 TRINITY_DN156_c1_g1_i2:32-1984(-)
MEERKKEEEERAAKVYAEFAASFDVNSKSALSKGKMFVRGGVFEPGAEFKKDNEQDKSETDKANSLVGQAYILGPAPGPAPAAAAPDTAATMVPTVEAVVVPNNAASEPPTVPNLAPPVAALLDIKHIPKPLTQSGTPVFSVEPEPENVPVIRKTKRQSLEALKEELKRAQDSREKKQQPGGVADLAPSLSAAPQGTWADNDSTNLYVANISPQVTEDVLYDEFIKYGPIGSIKVMWPRSEEERQRQRNCGFVAFMERHDAEMAKDALQGALVRGHELRISWSKAVPRPPHPMLKPMSGGGALLPPPSSGCLPLPSVHPQQPIAVLLPADPVRRALINRLAHFVVENGHNFEQLVMQRECKDPSSPMAFLQAPSSPEYTYYRWKVFSLLQGDTDASWRAAPFQMFVQGPWVQPPAPEARESKDNKEHESGKWGDRSQPAGHSKGRRVGGKRSLKSGARDEFEDLLRQLTSDRNKICAAMAFALDHAEAAEEVVDVVAQSLTIFETPIPTKVARLFLVSDILHNSSASVPNASAYRTCFEASLKNIFASFGEVYRSITGRMTALHLKEQVMRVLEVWNQWSLYPPGLIQSLEELFLQGPADVSHNNGTKRSHHDASVAADVTAEAPVGEPVTKRQKQDTSEAVVTTVAGGV